MRNTETPEGRSVRLLRVGEQMRHVLSDILMRGDVHDEVLASHPGVGHRGAHVARPSPRDRCSSKPLLGPGRGGGADRLAPETPPICSARPRTACG
jgi:hypothetical protein